MILLLGASGYIGQAFAAELRHRRYPFVPLARMAIDYTQFDILFDYVRKMKPSFIINAAGYTGRPNVDGCESARAETLAANALLPQTIARVCLVTNTPWGHVSSGSIYSGAKMLDNGSTRIETDLARQEICRLFEQHPDRFAGFTELDEPNCSFLKPPCSFYSGTVALAEEALRTVRECYVWRCRIPFNEHDQPRNFLSKLQSYPKVYDSVNSLSHLDDFVQTCLNLWERGAPFGIYNVTNPGAVTTRQVVAMMTRTLPSIRRFEFWKDDEEFYREGALAPRSNCILDVSKVRATGVHMRPVQDALEESLRRWRPGGAVGWPARRDLQPIHH
ncbi:MAG TPA: sugar nucleotide-binding protein [Verrucomicrobiae bacterium]|nr:sugar nucleotide-binding protein [Verrucomicrobiae bacterium]